MNTIKKLHGGFIIVTGLGLLPWMAFADDGCKVVEYADHFEVVCSEGTKDPAVKRVPTESRPAAEKGAEASRKRSRIEEIRSLNSHRYDEVALHPTPETAEPKK